jgi:SSS family solute:Na+ symporter
MLWYVPNPLTNHKHFGGAQWALSHIGMHTSAAIWIGIPTVLINLIVAAVLTPLFSRLPRGVDGTDESDYHAEAGDPRVVTMAASASGEVAGEGG